MKTFRTATTEDFKIGTTLIMSGGWKYTITRHYSEGTWEARGDGGCKAVFESDAEHYTVEVQSDNLNK